MNLLKIDNSNFPFKYDSLFDSIRNEPGFQEIISAMEARYQAEHKKIRQWLEENE